MKAAALIVAAALAVLGLAIFAAVEASAHHRAGEPSGAALIDAYPRLHAAAERSPRVHAGRDVLEHGRPRDGRVVWALVRREALRLLRDLRPAAEAEHRLRAHGGTPAANRALGRRMAALRGWTGYEWKALDTLWGRRESGWSAVWNRAGSGACHIPQALPCSKIPGGINAPPRTAIKWGLDYIAGRYGSPAGALAHSSRRGWY